MPDPTCDKAKERSHRAFLEYADIIDKQSRRYQHTYVLMVLDIDHFKSINDTWGHDVGDIAIQKVGELISENLRNTDILGRIGGEEFAIILPETALNEGLLLAEKIREKIETIAINTSEKPIHLTLSIGLTLYNATDDSLEKNISNADKALYQAKRKGRNRVDTFSV